MSGSEPKSAFEPKSASEPKNPANQLRNLLIVLVAIALSVAMVLGLRSQTTQVSLSSLAAKATPWEVAQQNNKPTLLEFYADWCTACQSMTSSIAKLEKDYGERVNFVMLNVDNNKWLPEISQFGVDGIPEFVYFSAMGDVIGTAVGQQPLTIMDGNLAALATNQPLPQQSLAGLTSAFAAPVRPNTDDPRSHGGLPQS
jgi:thiol-disulfide isomerase/thioredoxin